MIDQNWVFGLSFAKFSLVHISHGWSPGFCFWAGDGQLLLGPMMKVDRGLSDHHWSNKHVLVSAFYKYQSFWKKCHCLKYKTQITEIHVRNDIIKKCNKFAIAHHFQNVLCMIWLVWIPCQPPQDTEVNWTSSECHVHTLLTFTCSKSTTKTLEGVKYVQS